MSKSRPVDDLFSRRAAIAAGAGGVMFSGLIARLFQLQILEGKKYQEVARENGIRAILAPPCLLYTSQTRLKSQNG